MCKHAPEKVSQLVRVEPNDGVERTLLQLLS